MRVLILRALKLGDFLTGIPSFRAIRRAFPDAFIQLAAPREFESLVELLDGTLDEVVDSYDLEPLPKRVHGADIGVDLHGRGPESHRLLLDAGVRRLIAFRTESIEESKCGAMFDAAEHEVARWCRMLAFAGIPADPAELDLRAPPVRVSRRIDGATLIHPGAASASRRWPVDRWIRVAVAERRLGRRVVLTGGRNEVDLCKSIASDAAIPSTDVYAGETSLRDLAAIVAACARVVCGDTGIAHLATAYRKPSVLLFGPTPPSIWGPPARDYHRVLWHGTVGDPHGSTLDRGLSAIGVDAVTAALAALPENALGGPTVKGGVK